MASKIDEIVQISIDAQTQSVTTADFTVPMILAETTAFTDSRTRTYTSLEGVSEDLGNTSTAYVMAQRVFGQDNPPSRIVIARKAAEETYVDALQAASAENNQWFALLADTHEIADVLALAAEIATTKKLYFTATQDAASLTTDDTSFVAQLAALNYDQVSVLYHSQADTLFPEAAWVGNQISYTPGSNTWEFKTLEGIPADSLSATARTNLTNAHAAYYDSIAGVSVTRNSQMTDSTWIDQKIGEFWTIARMQEAIFGMLVRKPKIPYTDAGFTLVEAQMRSVLALGVTNGLYESYTITVPRKADIPENQRLNRIAGDFLFDAVLAGAVHRVTIKGVVSV